MLPTEPRTSHCLSVGGLAGVRIEVQLDQTIKYVDIVKERDDFKPLSSKNDAENRWR